MKIKVVVKQYYVRCSLLSCSNVSLPNPFYIDKIISSATATCLACVRNTRARVIDYTITGQQNTRFCVRLYMNFQCKYLILYTLRAAALHTYIYIVFITNLLHSVVIIHYSEMFRP